MAQQRKKAQVFVSPKGRAVFPHLHAPDTKFNAEGEYKTKLAVPAADAEKLVAMLDKAHAEAQKSAAVELAEKGKGKTKIKEGTKPYAEDDNGDIVFSFKMKAHVKTKAGKEWDQRPAIYDAKGTPLPAGTKIGGGSTLRVSFELSNYYTALAGAGVSLRLKAVQVIELKTWGEGRSASDFGFEAEEGFSADELGEGSVFDQPEAPATPDAEESSDEPEGSDDF